MQRLRIAEAAQQLGVTQDTIRHRISEGELVACHDPQFRGYVWLRELSEQDIHRSSKSGEQSGKEPSGSRKTPGEVQPLKEMVAMLEEELRIRDKQLEADREELISKNWQIEQLTRSRFIHQADLHNSLTSQVVDSSVLRDHVELVTNNISRNSTKIVTFNTLAKGVREGFPGLDETNFDVTKQYLVDFFNRLATIRSEMGYLDLSARKVIREKSIGDTALVVHAYVIIAGDLHGANIPDWAERLSKLAKPYTHEGGWSGDLMSRDNPLWRDSVLTPTKSGAMSVTNRTSSRKYMHDSLRELIDVKETEAVQV